MFVNDLESVRTAQLTYTINKFLISFSIFILQPGLSINNRHLHSLQHFLKSNLTNFLKSAKKLPIPYSMQIINIKKFQ